MKTYTIPVNWMMTAEVKIEAETLTEALGTVFNGDIPTNGEYLGDSFRIEGFNLIDEYGDEAGRAMDIAGDAGVTFD